MYIFFFRCQIMNCTLTGDKFRISFKFLYKKGINKVSFFLGNPVAGWSITARHSPIFLCSSYEIYFQLKIEILPLGWTMAICRPQADTARAVWFFPSLILIAFKHKLTNTLFVYTVYSIWDWSFSVEYRSF